MTADSLCRLQSKSLLRPAEKPAPNASMVKVRASGWPGGEAASAAALRPKSWGDDQPPAFPEHPALQTPTPRAGRLRGAGDGELGRYQSWLEGQQSAPRSDRVTRRANAQQTPRPTRSHAAPTPRARSGSGQRRCTLLIPHLHGHAQVPGLDLALVHGERGVLAHEAGDDVGAACDKGRGDAHLRGLGPVAVLPSSEQHRR